MARDPKCSLIGRLERERERERERKREKERERGETERETETDRQTDSTRTKRTTPRQMVYSVSAVGFPRQPVIPVL